MPTKKPEAVIFDWDETLAETRDLVVASVQSTLDHYGVGNWDDVKKEKRDPSKSFKENFPNFFGDDAEEAYELYLNTYKKSFSQGLLTASVSAAETIDYLNALDVPLFIISNKEKVLLTEEVNFLFPGAKFNRILGNGEAEYNKPHPAPVHAALNGFGIVPAQDEVWLVGDSKQDTDCALAAGCLPVLIGQGKFIEDEYWNSDDAEKIHTFEDLGEFLQCIKINPSLKNR